MFLNSYFENLTVEFYVLYILNMYANFHTNPMLFTIWSPHTHTHIYIYIYIYWGSTWLSPIPPQTQTYPSTLKPMARCTPICKLMLLQSRLHNLVQSCLHNINQRLPNCVSTILLEALTHAQCQTSSPPLLAQHIFYVSLIGERERESIKCGGNFATFGEHCSLFYILISFKRRADEKNNVFKLIYIKR